MAVEDYEELAADLARHGFELIYARETTSEREGRFSAVNRMDGKELFASSADKLEDRLSGYLADRARRPSVSVPSAVPVTVRRAGAPAAKHPVVKVTPKAAA